jgi:prepilin-type processing-associated H-X9-DG protein/prepilin-type N-terminal cleavage/methylation domain-containing protein
MSPKAAITHSREKKSAFTLTELLVSLLVLAILATLILAGVAKAKAKTRSALCQNNLKQQGIWLINFVSDENVYPLSFNTNSARYPAHASHWEASLRRIGGFSDVIQQGDQGDVFNCPSAFTPPDLQGNEGFVAYGYNSDGVMGRPCDTSLGLGGLGSEDCDLFAPPVPSTLVVNPSAMIAIGDGFLGWNGKILDGRNGFIGLRAGITVRPPETPRAFKRHSQSANYLFCDGHVSSVKLATLFINPKSGGATQWNRDNQIHPERLW